MRKVLFSTVVVLTGCVSKSPEWHGPPIVRMTCPGVKSVAIVPTVHSYGGPIPPNLVAEVEKADVVFFEFDMNNAKARMFEAYEKIRRPLPKLTPLPKDWLSQLNEDDSARLKRYLARDGMTLSELQTMDPEVAYVSILKLAGKDVRPEKNEPDFGEDTFDSRVQQFAQRSGAKVIALESMEEFLVRELDERDAMITNRVETLTSILRGNEATLKIQVASGDRFYTELNADTIEQLRDYYEQKKNSAERESRWVERLRSQMPGKRAVIAVGAAHVSVKRGIPSFLASRLGCRF